MAASELDGSEAGSSLVRMAAFFAAAAPRRGGERDEAVSRCTV